MGFKNNIPDNWKSGEFLLAKDLNALLERVKRLEKLSVVAPLQLANTAVGQTLSFGGSIHEIRRFVLAENLNYASRASSYLYFYDSDNILTINSETSFYVRDIFGKFWGNAGDYGYAIKPYNRRTDNDWEVIAVANIAKWIQFRVCAAFSTEERSFSGRVIKYWEGYEPSNTVEILNMPRSVGGDCENSNSSGIGDQIDGYEYSANECDFGIATYNNILRNYEIINLQC